jgi:hypothetical protein
MMKFLGTSDKDFENGDPGSGMFEIHPLPGFLFHRTMKFYGLMPRD